MSRAAAPTAPTAPTEAQIKFLSNLGTLAMVKKPAPLVARRGGMRADEWTRLQRAWADADYALRAILAKMSPAQIERALEVAVRLDGAEVFRAAVEALRAA